MSLIFLHELGALKPREKKKLNVWKNASPENKFLFKELTKQGYFLKELRGMYKAQEKVWYKLIEKITGLIWK